MSTKAADIFKELSNSSFIYIMNDYYLDLEEQWGKKIIQYWNFNTIYNALIDPKCEGADEIATILSSIGNDSTLNDYLVNLTNGNLTVTKISEIIFDGIYNN